MKIFSWKTLSIIFTIILIPFIIGLLVNYTTWLGTKDKVEITLKLDGWITIGSLQDTYIQNLKLLYNEKQVKNVLKISWRIINTGTKGIKDFEKKPSISYPNKLEIVESVISQTSPLLKVNKELYADDSNNTIEIKDIGIFNSKDYFKLDIYTINIPDSILSVDYFSKWELVAKSLDLQISKDIAYDYSEKKIEQPKYLSILMILSTLIVLLSTFFQFIESKKRWKRTH